MYVSMEMVRVINAQFINYDVELYDEKTDIQSDLFDFIPALLFRIFEYDYMCPRLQGTQIFWKN